ncbi:sporulation integral membrane protein YlbJ [Hathewaya limosa]|uniref:Sporulation integral membrane protein YlbJ n=1 Tax=Hathewaya limosa TaxID=1536 RepID=A0ABU0JPK3_HATLI|nr:sporulation integral membrane protein YlbJ [Hathewaya limosa]MDQ0479008.1 sporulation integral membrane protein YlbJ [Hathewaya limosa]
MSSKNIIGEKNINKNSNKIFIFLLSILIVNILIFPKPCINGSLNGLRLFITALFPCLFPFLVICNLIVAFNGAYIYAKLLGPILCKPLGLPLQSSVVLILSALCGYPMGAKYTADLYEAKIIDFNTAEKLLNIASNASPLFIVGSISLTMLKNKYFGYILLCSNYLSCFLMGLLLKDKRDNNYNSNNYLNSHPYIPVKNFSTAFSKSVEDAISVTLRVGGFVIIFSMLMEIIKSNTFFSIAFLNKEFTGLISSLSLGILEITNGCNSISLLNIPMFLKLGFISFLISFSGICIILQVYSFLYKFNFSIKKYILRKFFQGILSSLLTISIYFISFNTLPTFSLNHTINNLDLISYVLIISILLLIPIIINKIKKLFI